MRRIIALLVIQNKIRRFNKRRKLDELERQAQYVFFIFLRFMSSSFYQFHAAKIRKNFQLLKNILFYSGKVCIFADRKWHILTLHI